MKLYLIHVGFYDSGLMDGLYEQHGIFFCCQKCERSKNSS